MRDMNLRGRRNDSHGTAHLSSKLTPEKVRQIRSLKGNLTHRALGKMFGVAHKTVWKIMNGKTWKHIK